MQSVLALIILVFPFAFFWLSAGAGEGGTGCRMSDAKRIFSSGFCAVNGKKNKLQNGLHTSHPSPSRGKPSSAAFKFHVYSAICHKQAAVKAAHKTKIKLQFLVML